MLFTIGIKERYDDGLALFEVHDMDGNMVIFAIMRDGETTLIDYKDKKYILVVNKFAVVCLLMQVSEFVPFTFRGEDAR